ncbi:MAG: endopeptidase La [Sphingomonadales bacterium]
MEENIYPVLPLRDIVVFPHMIVQLFVGREKSVKALESIMKDDRKIMLLTQKEASNDDPEPKDLYDTGTLASVLQILKLPDGTVKVLVEGLNRARIEEYTPREDFFEAKAALHEEKEQDSTHMEALSRSVASEFENYVKLNKKVSPDVLTSTMQIKEPTKLADTIASHLGLKISDKQDLLATLEVAERLEKIYAFMEAEVSVLQVEKRIRGRVKRQMEKTQREYYLNEQMKAIQKELCDGEEGKDEIAELEDKIKKTKLSKEASEKCKAELKKLKSMSPMSAEATVVRNYLDWVLSLPWGIKTRVNKSIDKAEKILDEDHYGLHKVKERIIEYLAVQHKTNKIRGPILCLVGPPGVGKTSLGKSIARATGRNYIRMSLGGVRDEAEIRGHRKTYIGSLPGKVMQNMKKAGSTNPLFLLDEIDKMGQDFRGDPSSALLEVLDPEQNSKFNDHYLEVDYDLSNVMFVTTANTLNMPSPLRDRMEIIQLAGYTEDEKVQIACRHLVEKQMKDHGLTKGEWAISEGAIRDIIRYYSREAGVRNLEREIANLVRKAVKQIVQGKKTKVRVTRQNLKQYAGVRRFSFGMAEVDDQVGVTTGLAWTSVGGELLSIEALVVPGKGRIKITGKLGDVMQESIQAARSYVHSRCLEYGIKPTVFENKDIHIHVPEGATPKDGPSAGVAMVSSIVSALTGIAVRKDIAMTGEVTLRGHALPIGGLKEKLLAAVRGGITTVLIPEENRKNLEEIPDKVKKDLEIIPVSNVEEVLKHALVQPLVPIEWDEAEVPAKPTEQKTGASTEIAH